MPPPVPTHLIHPPMPTLPINQSKSESTNQSTNQSMSMPYSMPSFPPPPPTNQSTNQSIPSPQAIIQAMNQSINQSASLSNSPRLHQSMPPPVPSMNQSTNQSVNHSHNPSISQSGHSMQDWYNASTNLSTNQSVDQVHRIQIDQLIDALQTTVFTKKKDALDAYQLWYVANQPKFTRLEALLILFGTCSPVTNQSINQSISQIGNMPTSLSFNQSINQPSEFGRVDRGLLACCGQLSWKNNKLRQSSVKGLGLLALLISQPINQSTNSSTNQMSGQTSTNQLNQFQSIIQSNEFDYNVMKLMKLPKHLTSSTNQSTNQPNNQSGNLTAALKIIDVIKDLRPELIDCLLNDPDIQTSHRSQYSLSINLSTNQSINQSTNHSKLRVATPTKHNHHTLPTSINQSINQSTNQSMNQSMNQSFNQSLNQSINQSMTISLNEPLSPLSPYLPSLTPRGDSRGDSRGPGNEDWKAKLRAHLTGFFASRPAREDLEHSGVLHRPMLFGLSLQEMNQRGLINQSTHVPYFLEKCMKYINQPTHLVIPGLFRLSGESLNITAMKQAFDANESVEFINQSIHSITGLMKMFLREMPEPLLTFERYDALLEAFRGYQSNNQSKNQSTNQSTNQSINPNEYDMKIDEILQSLPLIDRCSLDALLEFLAQVSTHQSINLMTPTNLSICFSPNILRPSIETLQSIAKDSPVVIGLIGWLIQRKMNQANNQSTNQPISMSSSSLVNQTNQSTNQSTSQSTHHAVPPPLPSSPQSTNQPINQSIPPPILSSIRSTGPPPIPINQSINQSTHVPPPLPVAYARKDREEVKEETKPLIH